VIGVRSWCAASCRNWRWLSSSRPFSSPNRRAAASAACLRRTCQTIAMKAAAISGTSVSSCGSSHARHTSTAMPAAVVTIVTASTHAVGPSGQERNP